MKDKKEEREKAIEYLKEAVKNYNDTINSFIKKNIKVETIVKKDGLIESLFFERTCTIS